ncbi:MAG: ATP-binding protein [Smithella sp.]
MIFFRKRDLVFNQKNRNFNGAFLQPWAVAIVSAVLVILILVMGYLDLKRSDSNLVGFMEDQALSTISVLEGLTEENLKSIVTVTSGTRSTSKTAIQEEANYSKKLVIESLTEFGREIDTQWKKGKVNSSYLQKLAADNKFWYLAVLNRHGQAVYQSGRLQTNFLNKNELVKDGKKLTTIDLIEKIRAKYGIGFVALRRKDGSGTVVINLDKQGLIFWSLKVAVERGIKKIGEGHGIVFLQIIDNQNKLLGGIGQLIKGAGNNDFNFREIQSGKVRIISRKVDSGDIKILDMAAPLYINKKIAGVVRIGLDRGSMDKIIAENRQNIFAFMIFVVLISILSMWLLYHDQNRHLAGIIEMERRLEKAERLSALGQLAAGVAHEIRNPLNAISMATQRLKMDFLPAEPEKMEEFKNLSGIIRDEIKRLNGIIEEFLSFSKSRRLQLTDFSIIDVLQKIVSLIREEASARGVTIETQWRETQAVIPMDVNKLQQSFLNLIKNAMESIPAEGKITIAVGKKSKNYILVSISDTGCGMNEEEIEKIFSPEYTTKEKGVGLGVPLASEIIRGHGGDIRVISSKGEGTTFEVVLPRERLSEKSTIL